MSSTQTIPVSFEFFPPKTAEGAAKLLTVRQELYALKPQFFSVTYGAGGSTRELTHDLVVRIKTTTSLDPIPHLTCVCHSEADIAATVDADAIVGDRGPPARGRAAGRRRHWRGRRWPAWHPWPGRRR